MAALNKQIIEIPLGVGLDTKVDERVLQPGSLIDLQNGEFNKFGAISKRAGSAALSRAILDGSSLSSGAALLTEGDRLLALGSISGTPGLYQYIKGANKWASAGIIYPGSIKTKRMARNSTYAVASGDVAYKNGYALYAWTASKPGSTLTIHELIDTATGAVVWESSVLGDAQPRVIASGDYLYLVTGVAPNLKLYAFNTTQTPSLSSFNTPVATLQSNLSTGTLAFDIGSLGGGTCVLAYITTTPSVKVQRFDNTGSIGSSITVVETPDDDSFVGVVVTAALDTFVAYRQKTTRNIRCFAVTSTISSRFAPVTVEVDAGSVFYYSQFTGIEVSANTVQLLYGTTADAGGLTFARIRTATITSGGSVSGVGVSVYGMNLSSRPFIRDGRVYFLATYGAAEENTVPDKQYTLFLIDSTNSSASHAAIAGRMLPGQAAPGGLYIPTSVVATDVSMLSARIVASTSTTSVGAQLYVPISIEFDFFAPVRSSAIRNALFVTGMVGHIIIPGSDPVSSNFQLAPEIISASQAGGGSLVDGSYKVTAVYARVDANGDMVMSTPAVAKTVVTSGGSKKINIVVSSPKCDSVDYIHFYITDVGGQTFYENQRQVAPVASADSYSASLLSISTAARQLYTTGGVLDNGAPPPLLSVVSKGQRLYGVTSDAKLYYTKEFVEDQAAAFSPDFMVRQLLQDGGSWYEIAEMDGNLVVFGEESIQVINGSGFNATGSFDDLGEPRRLPVDTGVIPSAPVVVTDMGIFFKSRKGICLLTRSLQVDTDIGNPVSAYSVYDLVSAVVVPEKNQVRFGSDGVGALVYDMNASRALGKHSWSVFTNFEQVDAVYWDGKYCRLKSDGTVLKESAPTDVHDDAGTNYYYRIETPWIRLAGLQGFQRLWAMGMLGFHKNIFKLNVDVYYDYKGLFAPAPDETFVVDFTSGVEYGDAPIQFRHRLGHKCEAVKFVITDSDVDDNKESATFNTIALELGGLGGIFRTSRDRTV